MKYIHIAGTNGKGSVAEYLYNIIMADGASCGCFTSPHLLSAAERIRMDGCDISGQEFDSYMSKVEENGLAVNETLFAQYTAAALEWFKDKQPEYVVLETGLGGRYDPTNVIEHKTVILTSISYDHMHYLGYDLVDIAKEKCGIIKQGNNVITINQAPEVMAVIEERCRLKKAVLKVTGKAEILEDSLNGQKFLYGGREYDIKMIGEHQAQNAAAAIECARLLEIDEKDIKAGLYKTVLKARSQYIPGSPPMLLDGAHNADAAIKLTVILDRYFKDKKKVLIFACMNDKDYDTIIDILADRFIHAVIVSVDNKRGADIHELEKLFSKYTSAEAELDIISGIESAKKTAIENNAMVVVCGSFYLAGSKYFQNL